MGPSEKVFIGQEERAKDTRKKEWFMGSLITRKGRLKKPKLFWLKRTHGF